MKTVLIKCAPILITQTQTPQLKKEINKKLLIEIVTYENNINDNNSYNISLNENYSNRIRPNQKISLV